MMVFRYILFSILFIIISMAEEIGIPYMPLAHTGSIETIDSNTTVVLSGGVDNTVKIWDIQHKKLIRTFTRHQHMVKYVKLIPASDLALSVDVDLQLYVWDVRSGKVIKEHKLPMQFTAVAMMANPQYILLTGEKNIAFDIISGKYQDLTYGYPGYYGMSSFIKTNASRTKILLDSQYPDKKLLLYDVNGTLEQTIPYTQSLCAAALSGDAKYSAGTFNNKTMQIWDNANAKVIANIDKDTSCGNEILQFSADGKQIALIRGYSIDIWELKHFKHIHSLQYNEQIHAFSFISNRSYVIGMLNGNMKYCDINAVYKEFDFNTYARRVSKIDFSPDGKKMYVSNNNKFQQEIDRSSKKYYSILNYKTGKETKLFHTKHEGMITSSYLSKNLFITGGFDGAVGIWDMESMLKTKEIKIFDTSIAYMDITKDEKIIAIVDNNGSIHVIDLNSSKKLFAYDNYQNYSQLLRFSPDGEYLLYVDSYTLKVWKTKNWIQHVDINITANSSNDIRFLDQSRLLFMDSTAHKILVYDIDTKKKKVLLDIEVFLQKHKDLFLNIEKNMYGKYIDYYLFSHDGSKVLLLINKKYVIVDLKEKSMVTIEVPFQNNQFLLKPFYFSFDDQMISSVDGTRLYLWDTNIGDALHTYELYKFDPDEMISSNPYTDIEVAFSSDGHSIASSTPKTYFPPFTADEINIWSLPKPQLEKKISASRYTLSINDFSVYNNELLYGSNGSLVLYKDGNQTNDLDHYYDIFMKVDIFKDKYILAMTQKKLFVIDKQSKQTLQTLEPLSGVFTSALCSPDGKNIITTSQNIWPQGNNTGKDDNNTVLFWDVSSGETIAKIDGYGWWGAYSSTSSPDGKIIMLGGLGQATLTDLETKKNLLLQGHNGPISSVKINKEKTLALTGSHDHSVKLWDISTGKLLNTFLGHEGAVNSVTFHPTKPYVVSGSDDGTIKYWDIKSKELIATFANFENEWIVITPEGYFNGTLSAAKRLNILYGSMSVGDMGQVYDTFFRPDLVKMKLEGKDIEQYTKNIDLKRILQNKPPTVHIHKVNHHIVDEKNTLDYFTDNNKSLFSFRVDANNGGVGLIRIYQEGKLIQTIGEGKINKQSANIDTIIEQEKIDATLKKSQKVYIASLSKSIEGNISVENTIAKVQLSKVSNRSGDYEIEVGLKAGQNEISIEAFNKTNTVTSYRESITIRANIPKRKPKLYAIVAGVNEFESNNKKYRLQYSENDAKAIKEAVEQGMNTVFDEVEVTYLTGKEVNKDNILKVAQEIAKKAKLNDTVLFYISTHGRAARGKLYLVPYNNKSVKHWIDFEQTFQAVQSIKALNQIFVIDACESGKANDIVSSVYDSRASVLAKSSGVHMLLATTKGTYAFEHPDPNITNGVFTHKILQALKNKKTDTNKDSFISIRELSKKLKEPTNNTDYQYPVIRNVGKDIVLERINE